MMSMHSSVYLLEQLINNKLSEEELTALLAAFENDDVEQAYSTILEAYFLELVAHYNAETMANPQPPMDQW